MADTEAEQADYQQLITCKDGNVSVSGTRYGGNTGFSFDDEGVGTQIQGGNRMMVTYSMPIGDNCKDVSNEQMRVLRIKNELKLLQQCKNFWKLDLDPSIFPELSKSCQGIKKK